MNIIHVDMDAFFAAVEELDFPQLKGKPVIVGGGEERGVVTTANYIARKYGVHSAMPGFRARILCPNGCFRPVRHERYREVSKEIFSILYQITPLVEPVSIDEAYLDVSKSNEDAVEIAKFIKSSVRENVGLTVSAGVSYNKFLAKLASDWNKPDGLKIITKDQIPDILKPLPVRKIHGIGKKTAARLKNKGIFTVDDLLKLPKEYLFTTFGRLGLEIYEKIRGIDDRKVEVSRERKSYGRETTLEIDVIAKDELKKYIHTFAESISQGLNKNDIHAKTVTVKYRTSSFETHSKSKTLERYIQNCDEIIEVADGILNGIEINEPMRLIGLSVSNLKESNIYQMSFFDKEIKKQ
ncbi:DNA polymerase IV [Sporosalibacterium faouarense]|uniref:DNA polymerase IV n=1 Tax=Sporosalibacterium faouarense TaxID=516123 RepID=UPI00141C2899|nr:DNA polymerase IV [Sporosalibacterium faouarense]MTI48284.1 DNA polymerase IV [Bacillota bacterium]